ncbi:MAG: tripartite tricarboxylate transporter permease, partial [Candidatus Thermoplasmatota archaeon]|nr:tripartite tricarboxylate transporter permease [Candidatus Thermoplasmatota archaeon]
MLEFFLVILFCFFGVMMGVITGLLPGLHVNNVALVLLSASAVIITICSPLFSYGISEQFIFILISVFIISCSLSHTFHDCIPSTFLGAPDPDTALSVLPAHSLLLEGKGYEAVALSALGSYGAIVFCFLLILPIRFIIGQPIMFYQVLREIMLFVLIAISILMIGTEKGKIDDFGKKGIKPAIVGMFFATFVFALSGIFGLVIFEVPVSSPIGFSSPILFPALSGLFGTPTLLTSLMTNPTIPKQKIEEPKLDKKTKKSSILSVITGCIGGILVSIIPGITSATGTILAMNIRGESDKKQTIITLSAVNTACAFFVVVVMYIILRSRSGATLAVMDLIAIDEWTNIFMPTTLSYLLIALLFGGTLSYFCTLKMGKLFARKFANIPYALVVKL